MAHSKDREDLITLAHQSYNKKDYSAASQHLAELEKMVNNYNKKTLIQHNKAVTDFMLSDLKNIDDFKKNISQLLGVDYPCIEKIKDNSSPVMIYNYAVLLFHSRYYYQCTVLLENMLNTNKLKDGALLQQVVLLLMEAFFSRRMYEKTKSVSSSRSQSFKSNNDTCRIYERIISRANLMLDKKYKLNLKPDSVENIFIIAQQHYMNGSYKESINSLSQYKTIKYDYDLKSQGEDIWAAMNNNLGVIYLAMKKPFLATKYFQNAIKEHLKTLENEDSDRMITCKDRPTYIFNLGMSLMMANNFEGAFECLVEAARHYPNSPRIWYHLAKCCVKKCYNEKSQQYNIKTVGSGSQTHIVLTKEHKERCAITGESFAIPSMCLEFAALCLTNAMTLLPDQSEAETASVQCPPGCPLSEKQQHDLKNSILLLQSFIMLHLQDPLSALMNANDLLSHPDISNGHKAWAHIYAAEALISLDRVTEAIEHLHPPMIHELVSNLPSQMRDMIAISVWAKAAVCQILRGDLVTARKILLQINSPRVLPLQMYLEIRTGNIDNCYSILKKQRLLF